MGDAIPALVVLGAIGQQAKQTIRSKFEASLIYIVSSRTTRTSCIVRCCLKEKKIKNEKHGPTLRMQRQVDLYISPAPVQFAAAQGQQSLSWIPPSQKSL